MANRSKFNGILFLALLIPFSAFPQDDDFFDIIKAAPKDASTYTNYYIAPLFKGLGYGFNTGWYTTAKPHNPLGFDFNVSVNLAYIPSNDNYFTFKNSEYTTLRLEAGTEAQSPTLAGPDEAGPTLEIVDDFNGTDVVIAQIAAPKGLGIKDEIGFAAVPSPTLQLGIGLIKNTDLKVRYVPDLWADGDYSYWGIGLLHDITQWIPVVDKVPIDISIFAALSKFKTEIPFSSDDTGFQGDNQSISSGITGYTIEALVSKKIAVLTLFGGLGYNHAKTNFDLKGTYDVFYTPITPPPGYIPPDGTISDPISLETAEGSFKATAGLRLQLAVLTFHGCYVFNGYNLLNFGLGFTVR